MTCRSRSTCATCCLAYAMCFMVTLSIIIIVSIMGAIKGPSAVNEMVEDKISTVIDEMMVLEPSSEIFQSWLDPQIPIYQKFYFFDVQNADDVLNAGAKPRLVEIGPYTYRVSISRYNLTFGDNDTLSFKQKTWMEFVPELSVGYENDSFTTVNIPLAASVSVLKYADWFSKMSVSAVASIHGHQMFIKLSVGEILWGYEDPFMKQLQDLAGKEAIPSYVVGILPHVNGSVISSVINTGASNITELNKLIEWNGMTELDWWGSKEANMINGSDGSILHPEMTAEETIYVYDQIHCRSVPYIYKDDITFYDVPMMKFHIPWYTYANASSYPSNDGFCLQDSCPDGILNVTSCMDANFGISAPHFLYASPDIIDSFDGIEPNETKHQSYMVVEPVTGVSYTQRRRLQMNLYMESVDGIMQSEGIRSMYYPLTWIEMGVDLPESLSYGLQNQMSAVEGYDDMVFYAFIATAIFCFLLFILTAICVILQCCKKQGVRDDSYVTMKKDGSITTKTYTDGIPTDIYVNIPNEDIGNNNVTDEQKCEHKCDIITESTVLSNGHTHKYQTDDESSSDDEHDEVLWKVQISETNGNVISGPETQV
ncbi:lysosome membrane protein 2-like [Amphiura filiformis]|uniref:lysosome membrane protein 2-like n=1 Tax=Amphiura filiformis TaxID=82378 RepID=UPI003B213765